MCSSTVSLGTEAAQPWALKGAPAYMTLSGTPATNQEAGSALTWSCPLNFKGPQTLREGNPCGGHERKLLMLTSHKRKLGPEE